MVRIPKPKTVVTITNGFLAFLVSRSPVQLSTDWSKSVSSTAGSSEQTGSVSRADRRHRLVAMQVILPFSLVIVTSKLDMNNSITRTS